MTGGVNGGLNPCCSLQAGAPIQTSSQIELDTRLDRDLKAPRDQTGMLLRHRGYQFRQPEVLL